MKTEKFSIKRVLIALGIVLGTIAAALGGYFVYSRTFGESVYCQEIRRQEGIWIDHSCSTSGSSFKDDGNYVDLNVKGYSKDFIDNCIYVMNTEDKKVEKAFCAN